MNEEHGLPPEEWTEAARDLCAFAVEKWAEDRRPLAVHSSAWNSPTEGCLVVVVTLAAPIGTEPALLAKYAAKATAAAFGVDA